jgi:hypothetical protein
MVRGRIATPFDVIRAAHAELLVTDLARSRRRSFWDHPVPESWYRESSLVVGLDGQPVEVVEPPAAEIHREVVPQ